MSNYLSVGIITHPVLAANNRSEGNGGTVQTLQSIRSGSGSRSLVSGVTLKRAAYDGMQDQGATMFRRHREFSTTASGYGYASVDADGNITYVDELSKVKETVANHADMFHDLHSRGTMIATKADTKDRNGKVIPKTVKLVGGLNITPGISSTVFHKEKRMVLGLKADPDKVSDGKKSDLNPFYQEHHMTRYVYGLTLNLQKETPESLRYLLESLKGLKAGGNHGTNLCILVPEVMAWRFHNVAGQAGVILQPSVVRNLSADDPATLEPFERMARDLGYEFNAAGLSVCDVSIHEAIQEMVRRFTGIYEERT